MKLALSLCCLVFCISSVAQVVYKTVKEDGTVVYSGVATDGATQVNLSAMNSVVVPTIKQTSGLTAKINNNNQITKPQTQYVVSILSPMPEETLRDNSGDVTISAKVEPKNPGKFQLSLDNQIVMTQNNGQFRLEGVNRGAHLFEVKFLDNSGKILASSKPQTFYLHQASALINAN